MNPVLITSPRKSQGRTTTLFDTKRFEWQPVIDMVVKGDKFLPLRLAEVVRNSYSDFSEVRKYNCDEYTFLDGQQFKDPLWGTNKGSFQFQKMKARIERMENAGRNEIQGKGKAVARDKHLA